MSALLTRVTARPDRTASRGEVVPLTELVRRWKPLLDALGTNVFLADLDLTLVFANRRAHETLRTIEPALKSSFGISAADIVGGSIHRFHRDPARVERVLHQQGFTLPHEATFGFGDVALATKIDAIEDERGRHVGYAVAWEDVSALRSSKETVRQLGERLGSAASAVEQLSGSIGEIARAATQAADATSTGVEDAATTTQALRGLGEASAAIGGVVGTITAIAEQTNLLALNATIEAARAGEAGRGFAVVASEVKQLARDTTGATEDIGRRIAALQGSVDALAGSIDDIARVLGEVNEIQAVVASTVEEQRAATDQLARSVSEAAGYSREMLDD